MPRHHGVLGSLLILTVLASILTLLLALTNSSSSVRIAQDVNQSGSLRYRSLWLYGATHGGRQDWRQQAASIEAIRGQLRLRYPQAVSASDPIWKSTLFSLQHTGCVDWTTANTLRGTANVLTNHIAALAVAQKTATIRWIGLGLILIGSSLAVAARILSDLRATEEALLAQHEFQQALLESLQEGIVACDASGTLTLFNKASRELHGLPEQPLPAEQWAEHFDLYDADGLTPMRMENIPLFRALQGETVRGAEMVIAPYAGTRRDILANGQAIYGSEERKLGAVATMHDVTERRQMEQELTRLAAIVDSSQEAIIAGTLDGTLVSWNAAAERLYGYTASEMIGRHFSSIGQPHEKELAPLIIARLIQGEFIPPMEAMRTRKDGVFVNVSLAFSPIRDADGQMIGVSCISRDVTARKEAEERLSRSEARLAEAQRVAQVGSWDLDVATGKIVWSQELFRLFGLDPDQGEPDLADAIALYHPEDAPELEFLVTRAAQTGVGYEMDLRRAPDGGPEQWYHTVGTADTDAAGQVIRLSGTLTDITERKALEANLRANAEQLHRSEATLRTLLESAPVVLYAADVNGIVTLSEGTALAALGLKSGEAVGRSVFDFDAGPEAQIYTRRALAGESVSYDARYGDLWLHVALRPVLGADDQPAGIIGVCFDVTERVVSEERFRMLFEQSSDAHMLVDDGGIMDCNPAAVALLHYTDKTQLLGMHPSLLSPEFQPDGCPSREKGLHMEALAREHGCHRFEWTHRKMSGEVFPTEITLTPVVLSGQTAMLAVWHDLTERKAAEQQAEDYRIVLEYQKAELEKANANLAALAITDGLTGLLNHRAFQEQLAEEYSRATRYDEPLSLLLLDVDHFKQYNDTHGHPAGDDVLRQVARLMKTSLRVTDTAARYGGEEFVVILPQTDAYGAQVIAERIRAAIADGPWLLRPVTVSVGVCTLALNTPTPADVIACADAALYSAKRNGRNCVAHHQDQPLSMLATHVA